MFTGIVEAVGTLTETRPVAGGRHLRVDLGAIAGDCALGASISVSGVCLTVADISGSSLAFDVVTETLERSTLGSARVGDRVNIERSLRVGDRVDGHFVQGHVDGTALVDRVQTSSRERVVRLRPEQALVPYIVPKGSVALDGVSLTVAAVEGGGFCVALIPTTLERTTLSSLVAGRRANIETDIITRTVIHQLRGMSRTGGLTFEALEEAGLA